MIGRIRKLFHTLHVFPRKWWGCGFRLHNPYPNPIPPSSLVMVDEKLLLFNEFAQGKEFTSCIGRECKFGESLKGLPILTDFESNMSGPILRKIRFWIRNYRFSFPTNTWKKTSDIGLSNAALCKLLALLSWPQCLFLIEQVKKITW